METIRTFIAVDLLEEIRRRMASVIERLRSRAEGVRWIKPEAVHLTLKFLGDVSPEKIGKIGEALAPKLRRVEPFEARVARIGCFPSADRARIVWIGIDEPTGILTRLHEKVDAAMGGLGFPREERPFRAHLTVGRVRRDAGGLDLQSLVAREPAADLGALKIAEIILFRSDLRPDGALYTPLDRYPLGREGEGSRSK
ncbi:MAG: RNA 2',3'-cyclic phosphodiesterase [Vicinamibacteria bacterium]